MNKKQIIGYLNIENIKIQILLVIIYFMLVGLSNLMYSFAYATSKYIVMFFGVFSFILLIISSYLVVLKKKHMYKYFDYPLRFFYNFFVFGSLYDIISSESNIMPTAVTQIWGCIGDYVHYGNFIATAILLVRIILWIKCKINKKQQKQSGTD